MGVKTIDANMLKNMFLAGAKRIESKKEWINELNVFPVPDGKILWNRKKKETIAISVRPSPTRWSSTETPTEW